MTTKSPLPLLVAVCAAIVVLSGNCFANGPAQHDIKGSAYQKGDCDKGGKGCACEPHHPCFWHFCKPEIPPFLPVAQSLGVRSRSPVTDANQMQLSVEKQVAPPANPGNNENQMGDPSQKDPQQKSAVQNKPVGYAGADVSQTDERFRRLESQVDLLLKKMDEVLQRETKQARQIEPQITR